MKEKVPAGTKSMIVQGQLEWELLEIKSVEIEGVKNLLMRFKIRLARSEGGQLWYHKFKIRIGDTLVLTTPEHVIRGWIYQFRVLDETGTF